MERACLSRVGALIEKSGRPTAVAAADTLTCVRMGAGKHSVNDRDFFFFLKST